MTPYPTSFPLDAAKLLLSRLTGTVVPVNELAHAGWDLQGFVQGQVFGPGQVWEHVNFTSHLTYEECKAELTEELKMCCHQFDIPGVTQALGINWVKWRQLLAKVLTLLIPLFLDEKG